MRDVIPNHKESRHQNLIQYIYIYIYIYIYSSRFVSIEMRRTPFWNRDAILKSETLDLPVQSALADFERRLRSGLGLGLWQTLVPRFCAQ